jgi:hypothetical protein
METLSEYMLIMNCPTQTIQLMPSIDSSPYVERPLTLKEKILNVLCIVGYVFLGIIILGMIVISVWGIIQWPWMIVFLLMGLMVGKH